MTAWLIPCHAGLLDAVCDPGGGDPARLAIAFALYRASDVATVSPLSGECPHRAAHQRFCVAAVSLLPASVAKESAFPNNHFGADYRIQLPGFTSQTSLHPTALAAVL